jgi:hypothetical protein
MFLLRVLRLLIARKEGSLHAMQSTKIRRAIIISRPFERILPWPTSGFSSVTQRGNPETTGR